MANSSRQLINRALLWLPHTRIREGVFGLALFWFVVLGLLTEQRLLEGSPIPAKLLEDFGYYSQAYARAIEGGDPYSGREIGRSFLYPPPALLIVGLFASIPPDYLRNAVYIACNLALLALMVWGVGRRYGYALNKIGWWFPLAFGFAPVLELLHIGQINLISEFGIFLALMFESTLPILAGVGIALATSTKVTPIFFFAYLLIGRRWQSVIWGLVWLAMALGLSGLAFGWQTLVTYPDVFGELTRWFTPQNNSQALVVVLNSLGWLKAADWTAVQSMLNVYLAVMFTLSALLAFASREREPFFIILGLGIMIAPNIMWYHHYVFFLLPMFVWIAWSRFHPAVIVWCFAGLMMVQVDRWYWLHGLVPHLVAHLSLLGIVIWQLASWLRTKRTVAVPARA